MVRALPLDNRWNPADPGQQYQVKRIRTISSATTVLPESIAKIRPSDAPVNDVAAFIYSETDVRRYRESLKMVRQQVEEVRALKAAGKDDGGAVVPRCR